MTFLGAEAFAGCTSLISLEIGNSVPTVSSSFINRCSSLHSLVLPSSVTKIGEYAFNNCSLRTLVIPNSVKSIGRNAFNACNELTTISFMGTRAEWDAIAKSSAAIADSVVVECLDMDL